MGLGPKSKYALIILLMFIFSKMVGHDPVAPITRKDSREKERIQAKS